MKFRKDTSVLSIKGANDYRNSSPCKSGDFFAYTLQGGHPTYAKVLLNTYPAPVLIFDLVQIRVRVFVVSRHLRETAYKS